MGGEVMSVMKRTTVMLDTVLNDFLNERLKETEESLSEFLRRAILNQLEADGEWGIRDMLEESEG